jgi:hypothetical protein
MADGRQWQMVVNGRWSSMADGRQWQMVVQLSRNRNFLRADRTETPAVHVIPESKI